MSQRFFAGVVFVLGVSLLSLAAVMQAQVRPAQPASRQGATQASASVSGQKPQSHEEDGDIIFAQNCSRCHRAPESFSPRITGTVVRHMRVRAQLSRAMPRLSSAS